MKKISFIAGLILALGLLVVGNNVSAQTTAAITAVNGAPICFVFNQNLTVGSTGEAVKDLQITLNRSADTQVALSGAGSPGNETAYFGPATMRAVIKFQEKYAADVLAPIGLTKGTGYVGALTLKKLNNLCGTVPTNSIPVITSISPITGPTGTVVQINGTNLNSATAIEFGSGFIPQTSIIRIPGPSNGNGPIQFAIPTYIGICPSTAQICAQLAKQVSPGAYDVAVTNSAGTSNKMTFTVTLYGTPIPEPSPSTPISVVSPNGGETLALSYSYTLRWVTPNVTYIQAPRFDVSLVPEEPACRQSNPPCMIMSIKPYTIATGIIGSSGVNTYAWTVGNLNDGGRTLPSGRYSLQVCTSGGGSCDTSDAVFTIQ